MHRLQGYELMSHIWLTVMTAVYGANNLFPRDTILPVNMNNVHSLYVSTVQIHSLVHVL